LRSYLSNEKKMQTSCLRNTTINVCLNDFKILKKSIEVWKLWDLSISHDIICGGCGKNLSEFCNFFTYDAYKWKHLRRRIKELRRMRLGLEWKWRSNLSLTSKKKLSSHLETFSTFHIQHVVLYVKIWYIFVFICYI